MNRPKLDLGTLGPVYVQGPSMMETLRPNEKRRISADHDGERFSPSICLCVLRCHLTIFYIPERTRVGPRVNAAPRAMVPNSPAILV